MKKSGFLTKAAALLLLMSLMTIVLTGCSVTKEVTTTDGFKSVAADKSMQCQDATEQFASYSAVKEVTLAISEDQSYQIEFYVFTDTQNAQSFFNTNQSNFESVKESNYTSNSASGKNYATYTLTSGEQYMFVEYVDNTGIYVHADKENKSAIEEFIKALKY